MNGTSPHPTSDDLVAYAARRLAAPDVLRVSDHLAACAVCREQSAKIYRSSDGRRGNFLDEPESRLPGFDALAGEIDGTLPPEQRARLTAMLAASPAAREALADLAAFRDALAGLPPKFHGPNPTPQTGSSAPALVDADIITPPLWRWRGGTVWAGRVAALFLALAVGWWVFAPPGDDAALLRDAGGRRADLAGLPVGLRASVEAAVRTGRLPSAPAAPLASHEVLAGSAGHSMMTALFPVGVVVRDPRPPLRWTPLDGATGYTVSVVPADDGPVISSPTLPPTQTQWTPTEPLQRGETYEWQVEASRGGVVIDRAPKPPAGEARFQVLDAAHDAELAQLEKRNADYPLILGVAYWRAGIMDAAADQFHRLALAHAHSSVAQQLDHAAASPRPLPLDVSSSAPTNFTPPR